MPEDLGGVVRFMEHKFIGHQIRPGRFRFHDLEGNLHNFLFCQECWHPHPGMFVVIDELWERVCPEDGCICITCFQKRLGRNLKPEDFKDLEMNAIFLVGFKNGMAYKTEC